MSDTHFEYWTHEMSLKHPSYYKLFCKYYYEQHIQSYTLQNFYNFILKFNKQYLFLMPKNVISYDNFKELQRDISKISKYRNLEYYLNDKNFPYSFLQKLSREEKKKLFDVYIKDKKSIPNAKIYSEFLKFLKKNKFSHQLKANKFNFKDTLNVIKLTGDCEILYRKQKIIIVNVKTFQAMKKIGNKAWCITRTLYHWYQYVGSNDQFIIFDFNIIQSHPDFSYSFTFRGKEFLYVFDASNNQRRRVDIRKYLNLINK